MVDEQGGETADAEAVSVHDRQEAAELRDQAGRQRDFAAQVRDETARERDRAADLRDQRVRSLRGVAATADPTVADPMEAPSAAEEQPVMYDLVGAGVDRNASARDRTGARQDRTEAAADRSAAAGDRHAASMDPLTGVYSREAGLVELRRELARVQRTGHPLVLAFLDVDNLKVRNDTRGHAAGDELLIQVAATLQAALRPYDLIVRYGGDEFLCAVQGLEIAAARRRFGRVNTLLAAGAEPSSVTIGLTQHTADDTASSLIARADADLYAQRERRQH